MDKIFKHNPVKDNTPLHSSLSSFKQKVTENIEIRGALLLNELIANDTGSRGSHDNFPLFESRYSRMGQVKFVYDSL